MTTPSARRREAEARVKDLVRALARRAARSHHAAEERARAGRGEEDRDHGNIRDGSAGSA